MANPVRAIVSGAGRAGVKLAQWCGAGTVLERQHAQRVFAIGYAAGKTQRDDMDFKPDGLGPNSKAEAGASLEKAREKFRELADSNELVDGAINAYVASVVGTGIDDVEADTGFGDVDEQLNTLWENAVGGVDADRETPLAESQNQFMREVLTGGDCGRRTIYASAWRGFPTMPAIELIEAERLPMTMNGLAPVPEGRDKSTGNPVRQGVEYDPANHNRVVAYWVLVQNPKDQPTIGWMGGGMGYFGFVGARPGDPGTMRIPAEQMTFAFRKRRVNQLRGVPKGITAINTLRRIEQFTSAAINQALLASALGMFWETADPAAFNAFPTAPALDGSGQPLTKISGITMGVCRKGEGPRIVSTTLPGPQFEPTIRKLEERASRGLGVTASRLNGDDSRSNFSGARVGQLADEELKDPEREWLFVMHTKPWRDELIRWGLLTGRVVLKPEHVAAFKQNPARLYRCEVGMPGGGYINPFQEAAAVGEDLSNGLTDEITEMSARGKSWRKQIRNRVKYEAMVRAEREKAGLNPDGVAAAPGRADPNQPGQPGNGVAREAGAMNGIERARRAAKAQLMAAAMNGENGHANGDGHHA